MRKAKFAVILAFVTGSAVLAQPPQAQRAGRPISFVACPEFRDTARQCWLAETGGKTYYIGGFTIGTPPQLLHKVLVEGVAHDDEVSCGAINIDPISISPLAELDYNCDTVLPDNGTGPRGGSIFDLPAEVLARNGADVPSPPPLSQPATFDITFDFDRSNLNLLNQGKVEMMARAIMASQVTRVIVTGHAGRSRLSDDSMLVENPAIGAQRAAVISAALIGIGVSPALLVTRDAKQPSSDNTADGVASRNVRVEIDLGAKH